MVDLMEALYTLGMLRKSLAQNCVDGHVFRDDTSMSRAEKDIPICDYSGQN